MAADHLAEVKELFRLYDSDADDSLSLNELFRLLQDVGNRITSLPATAQVAAQEGKYLGKKLHKLTRTPSAVSTHDEEVTGPFKYLHLGSLAYIGNAAVFDFGKHSFMGGLVAMYAWRSIYWNEQVSVRTRALLMIDWIIRCVVLLRPPSYITDICIKRYLGSRFVSTLILSTDQGPKYGVQFACKHNCSFGPLRPRPPFIKKCASVHHSLSHCFVFYLLQHFTYVVIFK